MITDAETLKANEYVRRRILRLQQVREQSKNIAKKLRSRVSEEKNRQIAYIDASKKEEFETFRKKTVDHLKSDFDNRLTALGAAHAAAIDEDLAQIEWNIQKEVNNRLATERGSKAASILQREKAQRNSKRPLLKKQSARYIHRRLPSNLKSKQSATDSSSNKIQEFYVEPDEVGNECRNLTSHFEIEAISPSTNEKTERIVIISEEIGTDKSPKKKSPKGRLQINSEPQIIGQEEIEESPSESDDAPELCDNPDYDIADANKVHIVYPNNVTTRAEILRQSKITEKHLNDSNTKSIDDLYQKQSQKHLSDIREESSSALSDVQLTGKNLQALSNDNPFNAISEYIRHRKLDSDCKSNYPTSTHNPKSSSLDSMKDLIQHVRYAPLSDNIPVIPNLPESYRRLSDLNSDMDGKKRNADLLAATENWIPSYDRHKDVCKPGCRCPASCCGQSRNTQTTKSARESKPLRSILSQPPSKQSTSTGIKNIKYTTGKHAVKCKAAHARGKSSNGISKKPKISPIKRCEPIGSKSRASLVSSYDQTNRFSKNILVDNTPLVERHPKEKKNAYELAKEETIETDRANAGLGEYFNDEARRIRGERAMEKLQVDKDCVKMQKELDVLTKNQRLYGKRLPETAFMYDDRLKEKEVIRQRKLEKAFEEALRPTKVHRHPIPIDAPSINPQRSPSKRRTKSSEQYEYCGHPSDVAPPERLPKPKISALNVASWDGSSVQSISDDLDDIPTRDSDNPVKSVPLRPVTSMSIDRVLTLVEKQKEQLIREVVRMKRAQIATDKARKAAEKSKDMEKLTSPQKVAEKSKSPKTVFERSKNPQERRRHSYSDRSKSPKKGDVIVVESPENDSLSSTDERSKSPNKKTKRRVKSASPKRKIQSARSNNSDKILKPPSPHTFQVSSTSSSLSFQGFQICIEVKKGSSRQKVLAKDADKVILSKERSEHQDSSTEMSITASQFVSKKAVFFNNNKGNNNSIMRFDSSESTTYLSPPEKLSNKAIKTLFGHTATVKNSQTQTSYFADPKTPAKIDDKEAVYKWKGAPPETARTSKLSKRDSSSKSEKFYETESTMSREVSINRVSSFSQNEMSQKNSSEKGIQVSSSHRTASQAVHQNILKEPNHRLEKELDPKLKKYVRRLLEMSKLGVNKLNVDVSDVSTPSSSIINTSTNVPLLNPMLCDKVEKLKTFIDENYTLLEEFSKENNFDRNYRYKHVSTAKSKSLTSSSDATSVKYPPDIKKSPRYCEQIEMASKSPKKTQKITTPSKNFKHTERDSKMDKKSRANDVVSYSKSPPVKEVPNKLKPSKISPKTKTRPSSEKDCVCNVSNPNSDKKESPKHKSKSPLNKHSKKNAVLETVSISDESRSQLETNCKTPSQSASSNNFAVDQKSSSSSNDPQNVEKYVQMSEECSQRINSLSQMLEQIRKDKQATLSSNSSSRSDDDKLFPSPKQTVCKSGNSGNIDYVPFLADIPKPKDSSKIGESEIWDYHIPPIGIVKMQSKNIVPDIDLESFDNSFCDSPEKRPKPPAALRRHPIACSPHELSTIAEVDTPMTVRNNSALSRRIETSPTSVRLSIPDPEKNPLPCVFYDYTPTPKSVKVKKQVTAKPLCPEDYGSISQIARNGTQQSNSEIDMMIKPFLSFSDYVKKTSDDVIELSDDVIEVDDSATKINENIEICSMSSDDTLPDIISELIKRNLTLKQPNVINSSSDCSVENSTSSTPENLSLFAMPAKMSQSKPKSKKRVEPRVATNRDIPSISGIHAFGDSSDAFLSDKSNSELEKALRSMGIGWGVSTLKKTKETMALSSSSSSLSKDKHKSSSENRSKNAFADLANMSGSSIDLSTLLEVLNITDDFVCKPNANTSKISINKELEALLQKIDAVRSAIKPNEKISKSCEKKNNSQKDGAEINKYSTKRSLQGNHSNVKVSLFSEEANISGLQCSRDKTHQRTSTPVRLQALSHSSSTTSSSQRASNGLFGIESDLSSVKNISNEQNLSAAGKDSLSVPNMSLKFGKLFDSIAKSENCEYK